MIPNAGSCSFHNGVIFFFPPVSYSPKYPVADIAVAPCAMGPSFPRRCYAEI